MSAVQLPKKKQKKKTEARRLSRGEEKKIPELHEFLKLLPCI